MASNKLKKQQTNEETGEKGDRTTDETKKKYDKFN